LKIPLIKHNLISISEIKKNNKRIINKPKNSYTSKFNSKINITDNYLQKDGTKVKKPLPNNSENVFEILDEFEAYQAQNSSSILKNSERKNITTQSISNLDSYIELETYLNHLYKLHRKKE